MRACTHFLILVSLISFEAKGAPLEVSTVIRSSQKYYPEVQQALMNLKERQMNVTMNKGAFDTKVSVDGDSRADGFYDGRMLKGKIERPLGWMNAKVFGGYRISDGSYPSYEGKLSTLDRGETFIGASLSLLRDSLIDETRYQIRASEQEALRADFQLQQTQMRVQALATKAYWTWVVKGYEYRVYKDILKLAMDRASGLSRRIKVGDLARIYGTENQQYIQKREVNVQKSHLEFLEAGFYLSLFYRDQEGRVKMPKATELPPLKIENLPSPAPLDVLVRTAIERNLEIKMLSTQEQQAQLDLSLGRNAFLPKVDLGYELSQDRGTGSSTLVQQESRILLNVEVPLEYRKARGKKSMSLQKISALQTKMAFAKEKVKAYLQSLKAKIETSIAVARITTSQVGLARKLTSAEWKKFKRGSSDLILVNLREENLAEAEIKNLENFLEYNFYRADLDQLLVKRAVDGK